MIAEAKATHRLTGKDNRPTLDFARRLSKLKKPLWTRFVLVPGLTDDYNDVSQIAAFTSELGNVERADVLPFHQLGRYKWKELKIDYTLENTEPPASDAIERTCQVFRAA